MRQAEVLQSVHKVLADCLPPDRTIQVLEAGGGSFTHIRIPNSKCVTLLDISPEQIERNDYADKKILGDLEDEHALTEKYDLIVCFDVFEHLHNPELAFSHLAQALACGGLLVIGCPNPLSVKGFTTKFMPHGFHVWYYRRVRGIPESGRLGYAPFPTFLRWAITSGNLRRQARTLGLESLYVNEYPGRAVEELHEMHPLLYRVYSTLGMIATRGTLGRINFRNNDLVLIFRRLSPGPQEMGKSASS